MKASGETAATICATLGMGRTTLYRYLPKTTRADRFSTGVLVEAGDPVQLSPIRTSNLNQGFQGFFRPTA
jgi:hypothetical protein